MPHPSESEKKIIIDRFNKNVRGKIPDVRNYSSKHDGNEGHWLEESMGISHNCNNAPDFTWFEMKNHTSAKTSFGDWSASYYIFNDKKYSINRDRFMEIFGKYNSTKRRFSWSGMPIPKINNYNQFGQTLLVNKSLDINIFYSFTQDKRPEKASTVPQFFQKNDLLIAQWNHEWMKRKVEDKFNKAGWFKCKKNSEGVYNEIVFGGPLNYHAFIEGVKKGVIFFDSGMHQGNPRNYSQWRADNRLWDSMITEKY